jgi:hypothetical protein
MADDDIRYPRDGATTLDLKVHVSMGELDARVASSPDSLLTGSAEYPEHFRLEHSIERRESSARIVVDLASETKLRRNYGDSPRMRLELAPDIPTSLILEAGAGQVELDLTDVQLANLRVKAGVGQFEVRLPRTGRFTAELKSSIGQLTVQVPLGLAASITASRLLGGRTFDSRFEQVGDRWITAGYHTAEHRADISLTHRVGEIRVETVGWE